MSAARMTPHPIVLRRLEVLGTQRLTPRMQRITLGGDELRAFTRDGLDLPAFTSLTFDDHIKLILAPEDQLASALPVQHADGIDWGPADLRATRDYTPVRVDLEAGELVLDFVIHSADPTAHGPAEAWAATARPGDHLHVVGPKSSMILPDGVDWTLLAGDETALPAIERFLNDRPLPGPARIVVTAGDESARRDLPLAPGDRIDWVIAEPGDRDALVDAVRALDLPAGDPFVWAASESRALLPVRRYVTRELEVPKVRQDIVGYWHLRDDAEEVPAEGPESARAPGPVVSPVSWFAVRTALQLNLLEHCAAGADRAVLAERAGVDPVRLQPLLTVLIDCGVLDDRDGALVPGDYGDLLLDDDHLQEHFTGLHADQILALEHLAPALQAGDSAWARRTGSDFGTQARTETEVFGELAEHSRSLIFLMPAITKLPVLQGPARIGIRGAGSVVLIDGLRAAGVLGDDVALTVVGEPAELAALAPDLPGAVATAPGWPPCDLAILVKATEMLSDGDTAELLRSVDGAAERLLIIEVTGADNLDEDLDEEELVYLGSTGRVRRGGDALQALAEQTGWRTDEVTALGWGVQGLSFHR
ncbi:siderophore-interacting protein [Gordonia sp. VNK21]|uniref:siderophore-interacting protein n=1 Tax=Gordonia sp. VNK21 TaxID=3382483 RepID=UPI0038D3D1D9